MRIGSGVQSVSELFGKRQNNSKTSVNGNEAFPQTSMKVYLKTDDMLFSGGNGTGLSFYIKYAEESTDDNPVVIAKGIDENGKEFEEKININDIDLRNASYVCTLACIGEILLHVQVYSVVVRLHAEDRILEDYFLGGLLS